MIDFINKYCSCGSGILFKKCCYPIVNGDVLAKTAEALMRSRYVAYTLQQGDYLLNSWHNSTRPAFLDLADTPSQWCRLEIISSHKGQQEDSRGEVEFRAFYRQENTLQCLHELSRFIHENEHWYYLDGDIKPSSLSSISRNAACPCGSGNKFKRCCG